MNGTAIVPATDYRFPGEWGRGRRPRGAARRPPAATAVDGRERATAAHEIWHAAAELRSVAARIEAVEAMVEHTPPDRQPALRAGVAGLAAALRELSPDQRERDLDT